MGIRIQQLPPAIANQIAAGEVIERPASVVKELLENALDAGANSIHIEVDYGGLNEIKISDNGSGIIAEDLPLAIAAHATSKITSLDDLYAIDSMGFRGEALASITSVAKVTISSRPEHQDHAMLLSAQGATYTITPCARSIGTTIAVRDLFFNAPVRKRFLKNERIEFQAVETVVKRFALSAPHIALTLIHNNKQTFSVPAALNEQAQQARMAKIFGASFLQDAVYLEVEQGMMQLRGWISGPEFQRSQNDKQWVYINQRMVKDKLINHALKQAYDGLLHPGRFPACLLYFSINHAEVDVNVHPTKHEVRFQQPRLVHDFFTTQLHKALSTTETPAISNESIAVEPASVVCEPYPSLVYAKISPKTFLSQKTAGSITKGLNRPVFASGHSTTWIDLNKQYTVVFIEQHPYLVDLFNLYSGWLAIQVSQACFPLPSRPLLVPVSYPIPEQLTTNWLFMQQHLAQLGLRIEQSKQESVAIHSIPISIPHLDLHSFLQGLAKCESFALPQLITLLCQSQTIAVELLAEEERMALQEYLLQVLDDTAQIPKICVPLTVDVCRMVLHV